LSTELFFYGLREIVSEAERDIISGVICEEKTHLRCQAKLYRRNYAAC